MSLIKKDGYDFAFNPKGCDSCEGNCCIGESGNIWISRQEIEYLKNHLNISIEELASKYIEKEVIDIVSKRENLQKIIMLVSFLI